MDPVAQDVVASLREYIAWRSSNLITGRGQARPSKMKVQNINSEARNQSNLLWGSLLNDLFLNPSEEEKLSSSPAKKKREEVVSLVQSSQTSGAPMVYMDGFQKIMRDELKRSLKDNSGKV